MYWSRCPPWLPHSLFFMEPLAEYNRHFIDQAPPVTLEASPSFLIQDTVHKPVLICSFMWAFSFIFPATKDLDSFKAGTGLSSVGWYPCLGLPSVPSQPQLSPWRPVLCAIRVLSHLLLAMLTSAHSACGKNLMFPLLSADITRKCSGKMSVCWHPSDLHLTLCVLTHSLKSATIVMSAKGWLFMSRMSHVFLECYSFRGESHFHLPLVL